MKLPVYLQGLRATHYICIVHYENGTIAAVLSVPRIHASYSEAKTVFKEEVRQMRDIEDPAPFDLSYYK